jgi:hypothetical protein
MQHTVKVDERSSKRSLIEGGIGAYIDCLHVMLLVGYLQYAAMFSMTTCLQRPRQDCSGSLNS